MSRFIVYINVELEVQAETPADAVDIAVNTWQDGTPVEFALITNDEE